MTNWSFLINFLRISNIRCPGLRKYSLLYNVDNSLQMKAAAAIFQETIETILRVILQIVIYQNDIAVTGNTLEQCLTLNAN